MRILIQAANLQKGGALQVTASLLEEFTKREAHQFHLLAAAPVLSILKAPPARQNLTITRLEQSPTHGLLAWRKFRRTAHQVEQTWQPDAVFTVFGPGLWRPRAPHLMGFANGLYLFSDSRFIQEDWPVGRSARARYVVRRRLLLHRVRTEADAWWVETAVAQKALAAAASIPMEKIAVVPNALGPAYIPYLNSVATELAHDKRNKPFRVLVMGAAYPNKNLPLVTAVLPKLEGADVEFYFTLPDEDFREIFGQGTIGPRLINIGPLTPAEAHKAYESADAVMFPSKLETFSAVTLEAAAMTKPLLVSDLPWAREICGDSALYFDPWNASSAASALLQLMADFPLQRRLAAEGLQRVKAMPTAVYRADRILEVLAGLIPKR